MLQLVAAGGVALLVGVLFLLRARSRRPCWFRTVERSSSVALLACGALLTTAGLVPDVASELGLGLPPRCLEKPKPSEGTADPEGAELAQLKRDREPDRHRPPVAVHGVAPVAKITGPGSVNRTFTRWEVAGTDLGHMFEHRDRLAVVFGDTFAGPDRSGWRSNVLAWTDPGPLEDGLIFTGMVEDGSGRARELLGSLKLRGWEETVIPTNGISLGDRMVLHYMSVRCWGPPGSWVVNHSGLAVSDDDGVTWQRLRGARWSAASNFAQVAFVTGGEQGDDVHVLGIPAGRDGAAHLARVPLRDLLDVRAWRYWDGGGWSADPDTAAPVVPGPVGELSVAWSLGLGRWLMLYLNDDVGAVEIRTAERLTGPWSAPRMLVSAVDVPTLYAPYLVPGTLAEPEVYFTLSRFDDYNVYLMRARLGPAYGGRTAPLRGARAR
ncbi:MAG: DUF4185 domain-containing protein [Actinobacteria bacterium]|nr:DUF4185 domain-containing protein [Actinomycetota bacterium]